jgi:hypothetical protein
MLWSDLVTAFELRNSQYRLRAPERTLRTTPSLSGIMTSHSRICPSSAAASFGLVVDIEADACLVEARNAVAGRLAVASRTREADEKSDLFMMTLYLWANFGSNDVQLDRKSTNRFRKCGGVL